MRIFFISLNWYLNYLFFKIFLFGNRKVLSRLEKRLFKIIPLKPARAIGRNIAIDLVAEYEIPSIPNRGYVLQYARSGVTYAGRNTTRDDLIVVPVRVFCPVAALRVLLSGKYESSIGAGLCYVEQEFVNVKAGWFDGVLFINPRNQGGNHD